MLGVLLLNPIMDMVMGYPCQIETDLFSLVSGSKELFYPTRKVSAPGFERCYPQRNPFRRIFFFLESSSIMIEAFAKRRNETSHLYVQSYFFIKIHISGKTQLLFFPSFRLCGNTDKHLSSSLATHLPTSCQRNAEQKNKY